MRMLELIARGYSLTNALSISTTASDAHLRRVHMAIADGLAFGPSGRGGLDEELRTLDRNIYGTGTPLPAQRLSLTEFGRGDRRPQGRFFAPQSIDRWWGHAPDNDNLWRWTPTLVKP